MSALYTRDYDFNNIHGELSSQLATTSIRSIVNDQNSLDNIFFNEVTTLSLEAAKMLSELKLDTHLELRSLQSIEDDALNALVKFPGSLVIGLITLTSKQSSILSKQSGALELPGLFTLGIQQASFLSKYKGNVLELGVLSNFTDEIALALSNYDGEYLSLGIKCIDLPIAKALSSYRGNLFLDEIDHLEHDQAICLSTFTEGYLSLGALHNLPDELAEIFFKRRKKIRISSKIHISAIARERIKNLVFYFDKK